ncbi:hypothetical protein Fcan01_11825 [Folsomia candida]|uniref:Uncharacterized protein n=1 Tax=Folsomia candida TaxID=158441 RepID=A0A226E9P6_FOLCA|nr:hypothetical protein Fcan01_11825 [Folsomia candida]
MKPASSAKASSSSSSLLTTKKDKKRRAATPDQRPSKRQQGGIKDGQPSSGVGGAPSGGGSRFQQSLSTKMKAPRQHKPRKPRRQPRQNIQAASTTSRATLEFTILNEDYISYEIHRIVSSKFSWFDTNNALMLYKSIIQFFVIKKSLAAKQPKYDTSKPMTDLISPYVLATAQEYAAGPIWDQMICLGERNHDLTASFPSASFKDEDTTFVLDALNTSVTDPSLILNQLAQGKVKRTDVLGNAKAELVQMELRQVELESSMRINLAKIEDTKAFIKGIEDKESFDKCLEIIVDVFQEYNVEMSDVGLLTEVIGHFSGLSLEEITRTLESVEKFRQDSERRGDVE